MRLTNYQTQPRFSGAYFDRDEAKGTAANPKKAEEVKVPVTIPTKDGNLKLTLSIFLNNEGQDTLDTYESIRPKNEQGYAYDQGSLKKDSDMHKKDLSLMLPFLTRCLAQAKQQLQKKPLDQQVEILKKQGMQILPGQEYLVDAFIKGESPEEPD